MVKLRKNPSPKSKGAFLYGCKLAWPNLHISKKYIFKKKNYSKGCKMRMKMEKKSKPCP